MNICLLLDNNNIRKHLSSLDICISKKINVSNFQQNVLKYQPLSNKELL